MTFKERYTRGLHYSLRLLLGHMHVRCERMRDRNVEMVERISPIFLLLSTKLISLQRFVYLYVFSI